PTPLVIPAPPAPSPTATPAPSPTPPATPTPSPCPMPAAPIGPLSAELAALADQTRNEDWRTRWDAVNGRGGMREAALPALGALVERALADEDPHPRWRALWAIGQVDADGLRATPLMLPC